MANDTLQRTERDCSACEGGSLLRDDHDLLCDTCGYSPDYRPTTVVSNEAQYSIRREARKRAYGDLEGRPRLVGGFPDAYWGEGEYEFSPESGFHSPF